MFDDIQPYGCFLIGFSSGTNKINFSKGGVLSFYLTNSVFLSRWQQLVLTKNFNNISVYINGSLDGMYSDDISFQDYGNLIFGKAYGSAGIGGYNGSYYFQGALDDIRMYNRALTQAEITYLATH